MGSIGRLHTETLYIARVFSSTLLYIRLLFWTFCPAVFSAFFFLVIVIALTRFLLYRPLAHLDGRYLDLDAFYNVLAFLDWRILANHGIALRRCPGT